MLLLQINVMYKKSDLKVNSVAAAMKTCNKKMD